MTLKETAPIQAGYSSALPEQKIENHSNSSSLHSENSNSKAVKPARENSLDLICLSHLRWDFVYQRPQHLLSRCAKERRVFFFEEPVRDGDTIRLDVSQREDNLCVVVPHMPENIPSDLSIEKIQSDLIDRLLIDYDIKNYMLWYYTPMALGFTHHLKPQSVIYDCMDELSAFKGASPALREREQELFKRASLIFTGGQSIFESKRTQHESVHLFPSSVDVPHFAQARNLREEPADQANIPHPRLGFFGVIDERMDIDLLREVADARPDWHLVIIGPIVKIDPATLPQNPNIHYLGGKNYKELPSYLAGWDVAMLPFARNESTRFISPTKTPEYLAAGKPVISTSIRDVVRPYGEKGLVHIADTAEDFIKAAEKAMSEKDNAEWLARVDLHLSQMSWDNTWSRMSQLMQSVIHKERANVTKN